jgi:hypothetical protein
MAHTRAAVVALLLSIAVAAGQSIAPGEFPNGLVPDQRTAVAIAEAVLFRVYGEKTIRAERPYVVKHIRGKWIIEGAPPPRGFAGGSFHIVISQRDGRVLEITHDV